MIYGRIFTTRGLWLGFLVLALAGAGLGYWLARAPFRQPLPIITEAPLEPASDPRVTYQGPFRNIHPDVKYVGAAACANCHFDIVTTYLRHAMGNSVAPIAALAPKQAYDAQHHNPFQAVGSQFRVERHGEGMVQRETRSDENGQTIFERAVAVDFAIGSGARG